MEEFRNRRHFPSKTANCRFSNILQRLTVPRIIDQFWRERCQKKRKDVDYKLLQEFIQKYFVEHEQSAVENSFSTYVCYAPDGLFWLNLYIIICYELMMDELTTNSLLCLQVQRVSMSVRCFSTIFSCL